MDIREQIARIIEPAAWDQYDLALAPYAENRGSRGLENGWYYLTYFEGCRSVVDLNKWFFDIPYRNNMPTQVLAVRASLRKAEAILALDARR